MSRLLLTTGDGLLLTTGDDLLLFGNTVIPVATGTLALTGTDVTLVRTERMPVSATLTLTGPAPIVTRTELFVVTGTLSVTGAAPGVGIGYGVSPDALVFTGRTPSVVFVDISPVEGFDTNVIYGELVFQNEPGCVDAGPPPPQPGEIPGNPGDTTKPDPAVVPEWIATCTGGADYLSALDPTPSESWVM